MKSYSSQDIANASQAYNDFIRNGWGSSFGQVLKAQGGVIQPGPNLKLAIFMLQNTWQNYNNRTDLWQPINQALAASGISPAQLDMLRRSRPGDFSAISGMVVSPVSSGVSTPISSGVGQRQYGGMQPSGPSGIPGAPSTAGIRNYSPQEIANANQAYNQFVQQGWNSSFGQVTKAQGGVIQRGPALRLALYVFQQTRQNYPQRSDLWQPIMQMLLSSGFTQYQIDQLTRSQPGNFSALSGAQVYGESNPQKLVDAADHMFQQKGLALAHGMLTSDPRTLSRLTQVRNGAQSGDWANKQIMTYARQALIEAGAPAVMVSQATMHGEGEVEKAVEAMIIRANNHDQNAMGMLDQVRRQALRGVPEAQLAYNHAMQVISSGDTSKLSQGDLRGSTMHGEFGAEEKKKKAPPAKVTKQNVRHAALVSHPIAQKHHPISTIPGSGSGAAGKNGSQTPIDQLIAAAKAGNPTAVKELARIQAAAARGDQRAISLMNAIQAKTSNTIKGKQARAVSLSHGKPITTHKIAKMAGDFGYEYGPAGANLFLDGVANPHAHVPSHVDPDVANCITTGQCVGMARNLQAVRVPGANLSNLNPMMGWEHGE